MPTSLVTGAAGFIGSHVVDNVLMMGHDVVALDDLTGGFEENINPKTEFIKGSVEDYELVQGIFERYHFDYVYHIAAYAAEGLSHFIKRFNYSNNLMGSINLINASINTGTVKAFVFTSSIAVYGRNQLPMTEELTPKPEDPYGIAKYAVELDLKESYEMFGLNYIIFRPHNVYGERQNIGDKYRNVIGIFMNQILQKQPMTIFGDGEQTRAFSYIGDIAPIISRSVERSVAYNNIYNVGADTIYSINHLAREVAKAMKVEVNVKYLPARNEVVHVYANHAKVRQHFGDLIKSVAIEDGLKKMAAWVKNQETRETVTFGNIEVAKNLPESW